MSFYERFKQLCNEIGKTPTGVGKEIGTDKATVNYWKNGNIPKYDKLTKIANYFDVSVDYLVGKTDTRKEMGISGDDIAKVALFGGDTVVTDDMWDEVKEFVKFVKAKHGKE